MWSKRWGCFSSLHHKLDVAAQLRQLLRLILGDIGGMAGQGADYGVLVFLGQLLLALRHGGEKLAIGVPACFRVLLRHAEPFGQDVVGSSPFHGADRRLRVAGNLVQFDARLLEILRGNVEDSIVVRVWTCGVLACDD